MTDVRGGHGSTVNVYDLAADSWHNGLGFRSPRFADRLRGYVVNLLQPAAGGLLAIELGVGTGWLLDSTSRLFAEVRAIDASSRMRQFCQQQVDALGLRNVTVEAGDATSLDAIGDATADAVYAVGVLDAVPEPERVLEACARVLKPGGLLVISTANGTCPWHRWRDRLLGTRRERTGTYLTAAELIAAARLAGFAERDVITWGAAPQRLSFMPAVAALEQVEGVVTAVGLARYLGVLSASFHKL